MPTTCLFTVTSSKSLFVPKYSRSSLRCTRINGSSTKTSDLLKEDSVLLKVFSVLPKVILKVLKDHQEITSLCGSPLAYTVYLCVKQLSRTITMFFDVKNLPLAPKYRKRLLQISAMSVRNIHNHAKVEKTSATRNNKRWFVGNLHVLWGLKHGTLSSAEAQRVFFFGWIR